MRWISSQGLEPTMSVNNIFWSITQLNNWVDIVSDQYKTIVESGLINSVENINVCFLGSSKSEIDWLINLDKKFNFFDFNTNIKLYEKLCLDGIHEWSKSNKSNVLYIHSKGVSHPGNGNVWAWRKLMEHYLIDKHSECINYLKENQAIGCLLTDCGKPIRISEEKHNYHFSGNFWWSKTDYIKTLPKIPDVDMGYDNNYWLCERWILYHYPNVKIHIPYDSHQKHYY